MQYASRTRRYLQFKLDSNTETCYLGISVTKRSSGQANSAGGGGGDHSKLFESSVGKIF